MFGAYPTLMNRRTFLQALGSASVASGLLGCRSLFSGQYSHRPNILLIIVDDLNSWIGCLHPGMGIHTPNIDALARRGVLFTNAYCAAPYCNPSRIALFTGLYPSTSSVYTDETLSAFLAAHHRDQTYLSSLQRNHYELFAAGKVMHGSYRYADTRPMDAVSYWRDSEDHSAYWNQYYSMTPEVLPGRRPVQPLRRGEAARNLNQFDWAASSRSVAADERTTELSCNFLRQAHSHPYCAAVGFYRPHLPWYVPQRYFDLYPLQNIAVPDHDPEDLDDLPAIARQWIQRFSDEKAIESSGLRKQAIQAYLASISYSDSLVGKLVRALDQTASVDNTMIVLCSDNGFHLGQKLHWRKFTLWDEATHVPLIVVPPRSLQLDCQPVVNNPVSLVDVFPTIFDLAHLATPYKSDGMSLVNLMLRVPRQSAAPQRNSHEPVLMSWQQGNYSIRQDHWRYILYRDGGEELYNLTEDPHEKNNLSTTTTFQNQKLRLRRNLLQRTSR